MTASSRTVGPQPKTIAFVLYPGITLLDLAGPLQVLSALAHAVPGFAIAVVAERLAPLPTDTPLTIAADRTFDDLPEPFAVVVPGGGAPTLRAMGDRTLLGYLRRAAAGAEIVASVCTGALLLGAAGLLEGRRATTHWTYRHLLPVFGAAPATARWVEDGPVLTSAGVSAGIDMALHLAGRLAGETTARTLQYALEYDPAPPQGALDWARAPADLFAPVVDRLVRDAWPDGAAGKPADR
ncbi:DJ-1/PfpI family protein [Glycomyces tritici]|uniref:DJ-1/PfpI family protein n=1 Tax=Glycomyces tritici TaxID=2665176 RepID=A0ABT7YWW2_9ACTN|nr:DJ-1/PfpI family protein [Glycomyces tritici]MDN3243131.1 DJ-1/PfpI family protein [Glycomyces tritici]